MAENTLSDELAEAIRHSRAGLKALEAAQESAQASGRLYATHVYLASAEMARAIELAIKLALRKQ